MFRLLVSIALFTTVLCESYTRLGINPLSTDKLEEYLNANLTVIAMWSNNECTSCDLEIFSMYKMIYTYQDHEDVIIAAANTGSDEELEEKYHIERNSKSPQYRLFLKGRDVPYLNNMNMPTLEWIQKITGYSPRKESIMALNDHNYGYLETKYADRNVLFLFCKPTERKCQKIIAGYLVAADVFRTTKNALFAYADCSLYPDLCKANSIKQLPSFRLRYANKMFAEEVPIHSTHGENIIGFMNEVCGTRYLSTGHYDEDYGRIAELDVLSHQFMLKEDEKTRKEIMKKVAAVAKKNSEASRYFTMMKKIMTEGNVAIIQELSLLKQKLRESKPGSKESKMYSARNNVVHQFESVTTWKTLVSLHPWNFNYLLQKNHLLVAFTSEECDSCKDVSVVFNNLSKKGVRGITIATMNADKYADFVYRFHFTSFPVVYFYRKGGSMLQPIVYQGEMDVYALRDFVDDELDAFYSDL